MLATAFKSIPQKVGRLLDRQRRRRVFDGALRRFLTAPIEAGLPGQLLVDPGLRLETTPGRLEEYIRRYHGPPADAGWSSSKRVRPVDSAVTPVAQRSGNRVWSLEHNPLWLEKVHKTLARHSIDSVTLCLADIVSYGAYSWYAPALEQLPRDFALVVCDGPPGTTPGGRYGLLPIMRSHCRRG